jgi:DNA helicase-2/ATP-dependent DNA helicase PcrA
MCSTNDNVAILAAAGSRKTEHIVESALAVTKGLALITTYTNENQRQIVRRIEQKVGASPPHILVMGWFSFLIQQCAKPYQRALTVEPLLIKGLNFEGRRAPFTKKADLRYFLDGTYNLYRDGVSDFIVELNRKTEGAVVGRLERIFTHIFIDEVQDLVGYDLDVLDLLLKSQVKVIVVGDPRQHTLATNIGPRNKKYKGAGLADWFKDRSDVCTLEARNYNYRSNQAICDFADAIYPDFPATTSIGVPPTGHDGIFRVAADDVPAYVARHGPVTVLRNDKNVDTAGLPAMNIGVAKGGTFARVIIFPTKPMLKYLEDGDPTKLKAPERLYVAVTRARFSVAFVVPDHSSTASPISFALFR